MRGASPHTASKRPEGRSSSSDRRPRLRGLAVAWLAGELCFLAPRAEGRVSGIARRLPQEPSRAGVGWDNLRKPNRKRRFRGLLRTSHGMPGRHGADCGLSSGISAGRRSRCTSNACGRLRRLPRQADRFLSPGARFDAVLADYQQELAAVRNICRFSRCTTCHYAGQSCSWICRRRFTERCAI